MTAIASKHTNETAAPPIPKAEIFLRDKFAVRSRQWRPFLSGKEDLLRAVRGRWTLIAGCSAAPRLIDDTLSEPSVPMMHIWTLEEWDTVYEDMYRFTDTSWYAALERTLRRENQDLLVGLKVGTGTRPRFGWSSLNVDAHPTHVYLYEEVRLKAEVSAHAYLRDLNWFADCVEARGWRWVWSAVQVTNAPGVICLLWEAADFVTIESDLKRIREDADTLDRYVHMMNMVDRLDRYPYYPLATEQLDNMLNNAIATGNQKLIDGGIVCPTGDLVPLARPR
jgi:hypothetical protein